MWLLLITQDEVNPPNLGQFLRCSLSIATSSHYPGIRILAMSQTEQMATLAVGNMSNSAGVQDIDISLISW